MTHSDIAAQIWLLAEAVRRAAPLVHNITNLVVQSDSADAIAAVGGTQITLHTVEEARDAAAVSAALALNIGTLNESWLQCARAAVRVATDRERPWVLDPVAAGLTAYRTDAAHEFLRLRPTVLKSNASELLALTEGTRGRGADSIHSVQQAAAAARDLARRHGCVVVVTGAEDLITDGRRMATVANGRPVMGRMIGSGCMLTAVIGCFLAVARVPFDAALAAVACFDVAGELAAERAGGPGTLKPLLIDALSDLDRNALEARLRVLDGTASDQQSSASS